MPIEPHLMDDEQLQEYCVTSSWSWVATNKRVIKYRESNETVTDLHDLSYSEIKGISLETDDRNHFYAALGVSALIVSPFLILGTALPALGGLLIVGGLLSLIKWYLDAETSYFEFRGSGLIEKEPDQWKLKTDADSDDAREFVKSVRSQL